MKKSIRLKSPRAFMNNLGWLVLRTVNVILGFAPLRLNLWIGEILGRILYHSVGRKRAVAMKNLSVAFPHFSEKEKGNIARRLSINIAQGYFEMLYYLRHPAALDHIELEGRPYLDEALRQGKGVIGLTGHFGNFTLMHFKLAREGYPVAVVTRPMRNKGANDYFHRIRDRLKIKTVYTLPKKEAALGMIKSLRDKDLLIIQMDQDFREQGIWVDFFGKPASTAPGPVVFALRTGAVILPVFTVRTGGGRHIIKIEPPYDLEMKPSKDETVHHNVQQLTGTIERWVKQYPDQWGWINDRWKTRLTQ